MEPYPDQEEELREGRAGSRGRVMVAVIIGAILLIVVVVHLAGGGFAPHGQ